MKKIKLYHLDRSGHLKKNDVVDYVKDIVIQKDFLKEHNEEFINNLYKEGLSSHGLFHYLNDYSSKSQGIDIIFEYERRLNYPEKLSRFQAFYAFDLKGIFDFIKSRDLEYEMFKIYEVEYDYYEKYNLNLVRGWSNHSTAILLNFIGKINRILIMTVSQFMSIY